MAIETLFTEIATKWGIPSAIMVYLFWREHKVRQETRSDSKVFRDVIDRNTNALNQLTARLDR